MSEKPKPNTRSYWAPKRRKEQSRRMQEWRLDTHTVEGGNWTKEGRDLLSKVVF
jgi:hypothetical protein